MSVISGRSGASGAGSLRSGAGSVRLGHPSAPPASHGVHEIVLDALYERKRDKKSVRVLTVIVYVFCVSLAAIMLSLYYVFFWEPKDAQYAQRKVSHKIDLQLQTSTTPMPTCFMPHTGGSDTRVSEAPAPPATPALDSLPASTDPPGPYALPLDPYTQNLMYNATDVNITDPWPTWIMSTVNDTDTGQR